jgi:hypothetical protein
MVAAPLVFVSVAKNTSPQVEDPPLGSVGDDLLQAVTSRTRRAVVSARCFMETSVGNMHPAGASAMRQVHYTLAHMGTAPTPRCFFDVSGPPAAVAGAWASAFSNTGRTHPASCIPVSGTPSRRASRPTSGPSPQRRRSEPARTRHPLTSSGRCCGATAGSYAARPRLSRWRSRVRILLGVPLLPRPPLHLHQALGRREGANVGRLSA